MDFRMTIVGVGGVGGVLAGPLLRKYGGAVSLVARGARAEHLRQNGLSLRSDLYGTFTTPAPSVAETPEELGVQDFVLVCVKNGELRVCDTTRKVADVTVTVDGKAYAFDLTGTDGAARAVKL